MQTIIYRISEVFSCLLYHPMKDKDFLAGCTVAGAVKLSINEDFARDKNICMEYPNMTLSYPGRIVSLVLAATFGGYLLTSAVMILIAAVLPLSRADAVITSALLSFAVYTAVIIWVFAVKNAKRAWGGLLLGTLIIGGSGLLLTEWLR